MLSWSFKKRKNKRWIHTERTKRNVSSCRAVGPSLMKTTHRYVYLCYNKDQFSTFSMLGL